MREWAYRWGFIARLQTVDTWFCSSVLWYGVLWRLNRRVPGEQELGLFFSFLFADGKTGSNIISTRTKTIDLECGRRYFEM
jgi:hypothetical protein